MIHYFANPTRFTKLARRLIPVLMLGMMVLGALGVYQALWLSPPDYQQGETVRIMYIHVPAAWMALFCYSIMAVAGACGLIWRHTVAFMIARSAAPIGACFTLICLITGSLWGKPMWGTWWVWDARLTSVLLLFFLYIGIMALSNAFDEQEKGDKASAVLSLIGLVNIPIIKFSVEWWNTLHQPASVTKLAAPSIDPSMLTPLLYMAGAFTCYFLVVLLIRTKAELNERKISCLTLQQVSHNG